MRKFKTESKRLLDLMINSIYTNEEIFLRELISNASDAVDKLYFKNLTGEQAKLSRSELRILVSFDKKARTITVSDNGIGMTESELDLNLGTIAHSGSVDFVKESAAFGLSAERPSEEQPSVEQPSEEQFGDESQPSATQPSTTRPSTGRLSDEIDIIGQFGVGFYSGFMVAERVQVISKAYGSDAAHIWESDGVRGYTISETTRAEHGTDVILTLRKNTDEHDYDAYLSEYRLKSLIKRYSNYIRYPILMEVSKSRPLPKSDDADDGHAGDEHIAGGHSHGADGGHAHGADGGHAIQYESYTELETINSMTPIWKRSKADVSKEDYHEFYKSDFRDSADPVRTILVHAEGTLAYDALLFVPGRAPYDFYSKDYKKGLALYSSNVLIMEKCEELLPDFFGFVRGIVDSQDLTLNISRETLQHNSQLRAIARKLEKKIKSELVDMQNNEREEYEKFFENFGRAIKYGIFTGFGMNKDLLADLLLFYSAKQQKMLTLDEYIEAAPDDQDAIFYAAGESADRLAKMPITTTVLGKGYDVLLCTQDVDEFCLGAMMEYCEKTFKNVAGGDLGLETEDEKAQAKEATRENEALFSAMQEALGGKVTKVAVSTRLTAAPAAITTEGPISLEMEKILAQMPESESMKSERILELNIKHPVFKTLQNAKELGDEAKVKRYADILYNQALLVEGMPIEDPVAFAMAVSELMV